MSYVSKILKIRDYSVIESIIKKNFNCKESGPHQLGMQKLELRSIAFKM